jgi:hypothetical protein
MAFADLSLGVGRWPAEPFASPSVSDLSDLVERIILAPMSALLSSVQDGKIWREKIVWPNGAVHHFGKFTSEKDAVAWINAHPQLTKPEDTIDQPQHAVRSC